MADIDVDARLALSEYLRLAGQRFIALVPGEEEQAFDDALIGLADVLSLTVVARWDVARDSQQPVRRLRWVREDAELEPPTVTTLTQRHPFVELATSATEPMLLDDHDALAEHGLLSKSALAKQLSRLLVPGRSDASVNCVLVLSRLATQPWLDWEIDMLADFARLIPVVRARVDVERRTAASFETAPVGMTLRAGDHRIVECNQAFGDFLGFEPADLVGRDWIGLVAAHLASAECSSLANPPAGGHRQLEVPFRHRSGDVVWARLAETRIVTQHGGRWLSHIEDVTELRRQHEIVSRRATRDPLTGLANRHELLDVLAAALNSTPDPAGRSACAVVMLDLNDFKLVNDTYGHPAGDAVLVAIGQHLARLSRASDLVARYGGDEYVVVLAGPISDDDAQRVAATLATAVTAPVQHAGLSLDVAASVGVALGRSGETAATVIARADAAMYEVKRGRSSSPVEFLPA